MDQGKQGAARVGGEQLTVRVSGEFPLNMESTLAPSILSCPLGNFASAAWPYMSGLSCSTTTERGPATRNGPTWA